MDDRILLKLPSLTNWASRGSDTPAYTVGGRFIPQVTEDDMKGKKSSGFFRIPNFKDMRSMRVGERRVFSFGSSPTAVSTVQLRIGGRFSQRSMLLVDLNSEEAHRVVVVTCVEKSPSKRRKK